MMSGPQTPAHRGVVVDHAGRPIAGATVIVSGAEGSARTGIDGAFTLSSLPSAPIVVIVILPDGRPTYRLSLLSTTSVAIQATYDLVLWAVPTRITAVDGRILVTAGRMTVAYPAGTP